jgi:aryl-alcohol dehydrogenase-like predicted oxidoreductase
VTSVIVGARTAAQLDDNMDIGDWDMPEELWKKLDETAAFDHGYPRSWMDIVFSRTFGEEEF